jgi:uncharacterized membrane protein
MDMNREKNRKNAGIYFLVILGSVLFLILGNRIASLHPRNLTISDYESELKDQVFAKVVRIDSSAPNPDDSSTDVVVFSAVITTGDQKGDSVQATQYVYKNNETMPPEVKVNDKVVLGRLSENGKTEWAFENYNRIGQIAILVLVFVLSLLVIGGRKGLSTIVSLVFTCLSLFYVYIPLIISGYNIYALTILISVYIIGVSFTLSGGLNKKSLAAAAGCAGGVVFSGILYRSMETVMKLTGYYNDESSRIIQIFGQGQLNLKAVVFAMVTIGALGSVMDVAMSIASSLYEITNEKTVTKQGIVKSGLTIGKDIMGTMANTLILAYIGSSLVMVLIYGASKYPLFQLLNKEEIIVELLQSLVGVMGMLFTIPFTTVISSVLFTARKERAAVRLADHKRAVPRGNQYGK